MLAFHHKDSDPNNARKTAEEYAAEHRALYEAGKIIPLPPADKVRPK